jgi:hypothetical protein
VDSARRVIFNMNFGDEDIWAEKKN